MKKNLLFRFIGLILLAQLLSGCVIRSVHQQAQASIDAAKDRYNGVSPVTNDPELSWNIAYIMLEEFQFGMAGNSGGQYKYNGFDQPDPLRDNPAGGPSDGLRARNYSFMGPRAAAPPPNYWSLSESLEFVGKGNKTDAGAGGSETDHLYYLELPVLLNYNMKVNGDHELSFGAGPYAAAGLFANYSSTFQGQTQSGTLKFGSNADFPRMDYGLQFKAGYMVCPKVSVGLNFDLGLRNIGDPVDKAYNTSLGFNVGYRIK